jgi:hypothetical protein
VRDDLALPLGMSFAAVLAQVRVLRWARSAFPMCKKKKSFDFGACSLGFEPRFFMSTLCHGLLPNLVLVRVRNGASNVAAWGRGSNGGLAWRRTRRFSSVLCIATRRCVCSVELANFPNSRFSREWHYLAVTKLQLSSPVLVRHNLKLPLKSRSCEYEEFKATARTSHESLVRYTELSTLITGCKYEDSFQGKITTCSSFQDTHFLMDY